MELSIYNINLDKFVDLYPFMNSCTKIEAVDYIKSNDIDYLQFIKPSDTRGVNIETFINGIYVIHCIGDYMNTVIDQLELLEYSDLYSNTQNIFCFIYNYKPELDYILKQYDKLIIIKMKGDESFNIIDHIQSPDSYVYYIHSTINKRLLYKCNYFTIDKWKVNVKILDQCDCVGIHIDIASMCYIGNCWWSKMSHIRQLDTIDTKSNTYIISKLNSSYACLYYSHVKCKYNFTDDNVLLSNIYIYNNT
jgi:hypothetical protein